MHCPLQDTLPDQRIESVVAKGMVRVWYWAVLFLACFCCLTGGNNDSNGITEVSMDSKRLKYRGTKWWTLANSGHETHNLVDYPSGYLMNPSLQPLTKRQRKLVTKNPGTILAIAYGARRAVEECKFQFRNRRWNCPTKEHTNGGSIFGKILHKGCRETAFIYAITSAAVSHSVSRACSEGTVYSCSCGQHSSRKNTKHQQEWRWGGCSDNIKFGHKFAKKFVDGVEKGQDLRYLINLHNNEAGRQHIKKEMKQECKCHGMSGSCAIKTCWMRLPLFRKVGQLLKDRFDGASKVYQGNDVRKLQNTRKKKSRRLNLIPVNPNHKPPGSRDLVYFEKSPDFCEPNPTYGYKGTKGRDCDEDSMGVNGCDLMCCGRGHATETYVARERCNCTFLWCCEVKCHVCTRTKLRHKCN